MTNRTKRRSILAGIALSMMMGATGALAQDDLTVAITAIGNTLDVPVANFTNVSVAMSHVYDRIINFNENFEFIPGVAESWEFTDPTTFTFTVGDGFVFHNGQPLTLDDIVFSIERLRDIPRLAGLMGNIDSVEIVGDNQIAIHLVEQNSSTIRELLPEAVVMNREYGESGADYANEPIGTGPYTVAEFIPGDRVVLEAWDEYPGGAPAIGTITFRGIEENANRYIAVETGEAQFAVISYHDLERAQNNDNLQVLEQTTTNTAFISMNTQRPPFDNVNVRRAMAYATDKDGLAEIQGGSTVIDSMTPSMFITYHASENLPEFDLAKAQELLAAEGYGPGNPLTFETWTYGANNTVTEAYQALLSSIGVQMTIRSMEFGVFLEGMARGEYQMLSGSWNNVTGDPLTALENYWSGSFGSQNISFFQNERADELYDIAKAATDDATIIEAAVEVQEIAANEMPIIPTFSTLAIYAFDKDLVGVESYPSSMYSFRNAHFE